MRRLKRMAGLPVYPLPKDEIDRRFAAMDAPRNWIGMRTGIAAASILLLAGVVFAILHYHNRPIAVLSATSEARWRGNKAPLMGDELKSGRDLALISGLAEITFADGAVVTLEGPSTFRVFNAKSCELDSGKLIAQVPQRARGFSVRSAGLRVTDLGTEFGLSVDSAGQAEVQVFEGRVDVAGDDKSGSGGTFIMHLTQGETVRRVASNAALLRSAVAVEMFTRGIGSARSPSHLDALASATRPDSASEVITLIKAAGSYNYEYSPAVDIAIPPQANATVNVIRSDSALPYRNFRKVPGMVTTDRDMGTMIWHFRTHYGLTFGSDLTLSSRLVNKAWNVSGSFAEVAFSTDERIYNRLQLLEAPLRSPESADIDTLHADGSGLIYSLSSVAGKTDLYIRVRLRDPEGQGRAVWMFGTADDPHRGGVFSLNGTIIKSLSPREDR